MASLQYTIVFHSPSPSLAGSLIPGGSLSAKCRKNFHRQVAGRDANLLHILGTAFKQTRLSKKSEICHDTTKRWTSDCQDLQSTIKEAIASTSVHERVEGDFVGLDVSVRPHLLPHQAIASIYTSELFNSQLS